ncbi:unnamed protein product [Caenorhabditis angaria]|uniref:Uncharacterized protein n=1 Tax=Caenorhabditis angaria TaxID=860376 RepID=A0A9P1J0A4_9PELO|nr:unnamed protein product [Caenorhabditis angaria]
MIDPVNNLRLGVPEAPEEIIPNDPINIVEGARRYSPLSPPIDYYLGAQNNVVVEVVDVVQLVNNRVNEQGDGYHNSDNEHEEDDDIEEHEIVHNPPVVNPLLNHRESRYMPYSPAETPSSSNSPNSSSGRNSPINGIALFGNVEDAYCREETMSPGEVISVRELLTQGVSDMNFSDGETCVEEEVGGTTRKRRNAESENDEPLQKRRVHFELLKVFPSNYRRDPPDDSGAGPSGTQSTGSNNNNINNQNMNLL